MPSAAGEYILTLHALELALKAFLAQQGLSSKKLRSKPFRHNLVSAVPYDHRSD
jgi:hypothetical protein